MCILFFLLSFLSALGLEATIFTPTSVGQLIADITTANSNSQNDVIDLRNGPFVLTLINNGANGLPVIESDNNHTLLVRNGTIERSGVPLFRFFEVDTGADLSLSSVALKNGDTGSNPADPGGAVLVNGTLSLVEGCSFDNNHAVDGGAIAVIGNALSITESTFDTNTATSSGGAILVEGTLNSISFSSFTSNRASSGGAINVKFGGNIALVDGVNFHNNTVTGSGGAVFVSGHLGILENSVFSGNAATGGGGLFILGQNALPGSPGLVDSINNTLFVGNKALSSGSGGAISGSVMTDITRPTVIGSIKLSKFINNTGFLGGAIFLQGVGLTTIDQSTFSENVAVVTGGAIFSGSSRVGTIENSTFASNQVTGQVGPPGDGDGGAISLQSETISLTPIPSSIESIDNSTFSGNHVTGNGGAISLLTEGGSDSVFIANFSNNTLADNIAAGQGGGLNLPYLNSIHTFISSIVARNTAGTLGPDVSDTVGGITSESFNLIGNNSGSDFIDGLPNNNHSFVGTEQNPIDPDLGPLSNNGGPTETRALRVGSIAIDKGANPLALLFDQRGVGFARQNGPETDIGAFELQPSPDCKNCGRRRRHRGGAGSAGLIAPPLWATDPVPVLPFIPIATPVESAPTSAILVGETFCTDEIDEAETRIESSGCSAIDGQGQGSSNLILLLFVLLIRFWSKRKAISETPNCR